MKLQPAVRKETKYIAVGSVILGALMLLVFFTLHLYLPDLVPFDFRVILGAAGGTAVAVLNFFWMALTVQQVAQESDDDRAKSRMKLSYTRRMMLQLLWGALSIFLPFVNAAAGIIPLFFQSILLKLRSLPAVASAVEGSGDEKEGGA